MNLHLLSEREAEFHLRIRLVEDLDICIWLSSRVWQVGGKHSVFFTGFSRSWDLCIDIQNQQKGTRTNTVPIIKVYSCSRNKVCKASFLQVHSSHIEAITRHKQVVLSKFFPKIKKKRIFCTLKFNRILFKQNCRARKIHLRNRIKT